jgi:Flp pilus assembly protein TadB
VEPPDWSEPRGELARRASAALTLAERTGAPLAELLDRVEADARAADRVAAGLTAQSAGARATALLLAGLPGAGLALGVTIGADPVHVLLHEPVGAACALGALALQLTGLAWSQRLATPSGWAASRPVRRLESPLWPVARRRLRRLELVPAKPRVGLAGRAASAPVAGGFAGITVAIAVGGVPGLVAGVPVAFLVARGMRTLQARDRNAERLRAAADLPLAADLLGAVLRAGAPVDRSADAVGSALGGALGERFLRVARALRLGATSEEAWGHLADLESGPRLAGAAIRSATSGAAFAGALDRLAGDLRAARAAAADAAARRAGVLIVLPLGLCFLPAFILAGLVPVIVAVLRDVL